MRSTLDSHVMGQRGFTTSDILGVVEKPSRYLQSQLNSKISQPDAQLIEVGDSLLRLWLRAIRLALKQNSPGEAYRQNALLDIMSAAIHPILYFVSNLSAQTLPGHVAKASVLLTRVSFRTVGSSLDGFVGPKLTSDESEVTDMLTISLCIDFLNGSVDAPESSSACTRLLNGDRL